YVAFSSVRLGRRSIDVLMDRAPTGTISRIEETAAAVPGVAEVRRVRFRYVGGQPQADIVVAISRSTPLESAHAVTEKVEEAIRALQPGTDVVVHVEPLADEAAIADIVRMIAAREPRITDIHNVFVTSGSDGLHISFHIKMEGTMPLQDAHAISDQLEASIAKGIPGTARVDTHVEPLEMHESVIDVTADQNELVDWARSFAERQPEVRDCHEIVVTDSDGDLTMVMHCHAGAGLAVTSIHEVATRIESAVHARWSAVKRVTVHFEPD
ncbi:MAG TPA: cation transporter dimerization domain-containing protein, partial [Actinomycetota bacterium]|nr:cation transporter dimerization domain-containing protein [Actinomycetota bacterium]